VEYLILFLIKSNSFEPIEPIYSFNHMKVNLELYMLVKKSLN